MGENNSSQYDIFAADFSATRQHSWPEFDIFLPLIKPGEKVLDIGCGNGRLRNFLPKNIAYTGADISENLLKIAEKSFPNDDFFHADFSKTWPFQNQQFDWVLGIASFHHILDTAGQKFFMREAYCVLKPGGKIFLTTWVLPKKYFWSNFWRGRVFTDNWIIPFGKEKFPRIYRRVSTSTLQKRCTEAGFQIHSSGIFPGRNYWILAEKMHNG